MQQREASLDPGRVESSTIEDDLGIQIKSALMTIYDVLLELIWIRSTSQSVHRVMQSLGDAVNDCSVAVDKASKSGSDEYMEAVIDEECGVIENLIGAAYVTCQAEITGVVAHVMRIHASAKEQGHSLNSSDGTKAGIMALGSKLVGSSPYTEIQVINAFANYFKHADEWDQRWAALKGQQKQTADIVAAVGAKEFCTGDLRAGLEALGIDYTKLHLLATAVHTWASTVHSTYESELKQKQLL